MPIITLETPIAAPPDRCFLLSLSIDLHKESTAETSEQAIGGVTHGLIGPGETVTWRGRHFGLMLTHESIISAYERPRHFRDVMVTGMFRNFEHDHFFEPAANGNTLMRDRLFFSAPLGFLGKLAEIAVLTSYLRRFLTIRNRVIQKAAEAEPQVWSRYLAGAPELR